MRRKVAEVLDRSGLSPRSHSGKDLMEILETYPRDELFQIATDELYRSVIGVLRLAGRRQLRVFLRRDAYGRFISCLVYLPRDKFTTGQPAEDAGDPASRAERQSVSTTRRGSPSRRLRGSTSSCAPIRATRRATSTSTRLTELLAAATRLWEDDFRLVLENKIGEEHAAKALYLRYALRAAGDVQGRARPVRGRQGRREARAARRAGRARHAPVPQAPRRRERAVQGLPLRRADDALGRAAGAALARRAASPTSGRTRSTASEGTVYLYDFGLQLPAGSREVAEVRAQVENAFSAAWRGEAEVDGFNALVLTAGLTWRQVVVLRAYAKYLRQAGTIFSQEYMETTLLAYPGIAALLVALFETRFDPRLRLGRRGPRSCSPRSWSRRCTGSSTTCTASTRTGSSAPT